MRRREFIAGIGGEQRWRGHVAARAQEHLRRIGVLVVSAKDDPDTAARVAGFRQETAAAALAIKIMPRTIESAADIETAMQSVSREPNGAVLALPDSANIAHRDLLIALAAQHRLPAVYFARLFVAAGGLMSYGTDVFDVFRQAASYVSAILRGAAPSELPVQAPTKYETTVNFKTAHALGLDVPPSLLVRADEVIQ